MKKIIALLIIAFLLAPGLISAHQPRIVEGRQTNVPNPEISKAYYGQLKGQPDVFYINSDKPFELYVNVLVPDIAGQKKDVSAVVFKNNGAPTLIAALSGIDFEWEKFYEPFGADTYWMGPEFKTRVEAGKYEISVFSANNDSKYSLAIGEVESFNFIETFNAFIVIPQLKKNFFNEATIGFFKSPFGWGLIVVMYLIAFVFGFGLKFVMRKFYKKAKVPQKNIGMGDRLIRFAIGLALLLWAVFTTWNLILIFLSGFMMFEAIFSWCGLYAAIGKNTCPVN